MNSRAIAIIVMGVGFVVLGLGTGRFVREASVPKQARFAVEESTLNLGSVSVQRIFERSVQITNTGNRDLDIRVTRVTCGCTSADLDRNSIPPSESATLSVSVASPDLPGSFGSRIYFETSDPELPEVYITVTGMATAAFKLEPRVVNFGNVEHDSLPATRSAIVTLTDASPVRKENIVVNTGTPHVLAKLIQSTNQIQIEVRLESNAPYGVFRDDLYVSGKTNDEYMLRLPLIAEVRGVFGANPSTIFFGDAGEGTALKRAVQINAPERWRIVRMQLLDGVLQNFLELDHFTHLNGDIELIVTLAPMEAGKSLRDSISIQMEHAETDESIELRIPVIASSSIVAVKS